MNGLKEIVRIVPAAAGLAVRSWPIVLSVGAVATVAWLSLGYWIAGEDKNALAGKLKAAVQAGFLETQIHPYLLRPGYSLPLWQNNDCIVLYMLIAPGYPSRLQEALSPLEPNRTTQNACDTLPDHLNGATMSGTFHHRYIHGPRLGTALMLKLMPVGALPWVMLAVVHAFAAMLAIVAGARAYAYWRRGSRDEAFVAAGYCVVGFSLLVFWGLSQFGFSSSFAFADLAVLLLVWSFFLCNPVRMTDGRFLLICSVAGALIAIFEFLTGQIPIAAALIPVCLAISSFSAPDDHAVIKRSMAGPVVFVATATCCFLFKYLMAIAVFGTGMVANIRDEFLLVTVGRPQLLLSENARSLFETLGLPTTYEGGFLHAAFWLFASFGLAMPVIGLGRFLVGAAIIVFCSAALVAGVIVANARAASSIDGTRIAALLWSLVVLAVWYVVFHMHTIQHTSFMSRPLVLIMIVAAIAWLQVARSNRIVRS